MKSIYVSPEIMYEDFSLSTNIAAGCEVYVGTPSPGQCTIMLGPKPLFDSDNIGGICETTPPPGKYDSACYHVPEENYNLFNS